METSRTEKETSTNTIFIHSYLGTACCLTDHWLNLDLESAIHMFRVLAFVITFKFVIKH